MGELNPGHGGGPGFEDLVWVLRVGLERGHGLLDAVERSVIEAMLALRGPPARLYARLLSRVPEVFRVDRIAIAEVQDVPGALAELSAAGLVDDEVDGAARNATATVAELKMALRARGMSTRGPRADLVAVLGDTPWDAGGWVRIRHRGLVRRLEQLVFLDRWRDRSALVVERVGAMAWPSYSLTDGPPLFQSREDWLAWEAIAARLASEPGDAPGFDADAALDALGAVPEAPGGLNLVGPLADQVLQQAEAAVRDGRPQDAARWLDALVEGGWVRPAKIAVRRARAHERAGDGARARELLLEARADARPHERIAIGRTGRRIGRVLRRGFPPDPPLRETPERRVALAASARVGLRPGWGRGVPVEAAVVEHLASVGRRAVFGEGALWRTLCALLFAEVYFLPVPGALPARFLAGPLDLGRSGFVLRRQEAVEEVRAAILAGDAPRRVRAADAQWRGTILAGAAWHLFDGPTLIDVAEGVGPAALASIMAELLEGRAGGLPDLVVLPGAPTAVSGWPSRLGAGALLVEVKGPGDTVRDEQAAWFHRLLEAGVPVEVWRVRAAREAAISVAL